MKLTLADQQRAKTFIQSKARPLEQALYAFHLEGWGRDTVLSALAAFQNPDGGLRKVTDSLLAHLASHGDPKDMHEIACYLSLVETPALPQDLRRRALRKRRRRPMLRGIRRAAVAARPRGSDEPASEELTGGPTFEKLAYVLPDRMCFVRRQPRDEPAPSKGRALPRAY